MFWGPWSLRTRLWSSLTIWPAPLLPFPSPGGPPPSPPNAVRASRHRIPVQSPARHSRARRESGVGGDSFGVDGHDAPHGGDFYCPRVRVLAAAQALTGWMACLPALLSWERALSCHQWPYLSGQQIRHIKHSLDGPGPAWRTVRNHSSLLLRTSIWRWDAACCALSGGPPNPESDPSPTTRLPTHASLTRCKTIKMFIYLTI